MPTRFVGRGGELVARRRLEDSGWELLATNYRFGRREVDVVARKGDVVAFVEVKTRSSPGCGLPEEAVTLRQRRDIEMVAREFLVRRKILGPKVRFDVVAVEVVRGQVVRCEHIEDAWRPGWH